MKLTRGVAEYDLESKEPVAVRLGSVDYVLTRVDWRSLKTAVEQHRPSVLGIPVYYAVTPIGIPVYYSVTPNGRTFLYPVPSDNWVLITDADVTA